MDNGKVSIHGKEYKTVALRVNEFREKCGLEYGIETDLISNADLVVMKATIKHLGGSVVASGYAEEVRGSSNINSTSALENCETSAIGRALAAFGLAGTEYASANEVSEAIIQQNCMAAKKEVSDYFVKYNKLVNEHLEEIRCFKCDVANNITKGAAEAWLDIPKEDRRFLSKLAPAKGGILTTEEREFIDKNQELFAEPDMAE
jgi:3-deoxy-D-manno-octulosonate 8-phosphate phosphatase KdsC-like HAD superfamily phosphatase